MSKNNDSQRRELEEGKNNIRNKMDREKTVIVRERDLREEESK